MSAAIERIQLAYSPDRWREYGHQLIELLAEHLRTVTTGVGPVLNWGSPPQNIAAATARLHEPASDELIDRLRAAVSDAAHGQNLHHPRYIGHQVPASSPVAALFDLVGSVTNQVMAIYEMGPWASAVEQSLVLELGQRFGLPVGEFAGLITHGGSLANLTALLTARNVSLAGAWEHGTARPGRPPVLLVQADAHYGVVRSAGILGLGTRQVIKVPLDERRRMNPVALDQLLASLRSVGQPVVAVVACACATPIGAFDPIDAIADVCARHQVWLHVDAAHGGAAVFSDTHRHLLAGLERADSFICDAHKLLFVPALCAFVFYRNKAHRLATFHQEAAYLFDPSTPAGTAEYDSGVATLECTKRAAGFGLWGLWSMFGPQLFADLVDGCFSRARELWTLLNAQPDFVTLHEPQCNILCFRYVPEALRHRPAVEIGQFNQQIRRVLIESGDSYLVQTTLDGVPALRATVMNPLTSTDDLCHLLSPSAAAAVNCSRSCGERDLNTSRFAPARGTSPRS
ncbi:MAG: aminotransferase class I/II-fold pyridoxal phosphate-dependent enzyme [Planctomycetaceae bacterium]